MIPGLIAGGLVAFFFAGGQPAFVTAILFCALITYSIVISAQIKALNEKIEDVEKKAVTTREHKKDLKLTTGRIKAVDEKINFVAQVASNEIEELANSVGSEVHELAVYIANEKFGRPEGEGDTID